MYDVKIIFAKVFIHLEYTDSIIFTCLDLEKLAVIKTLPQKEVFSIHSNYTKNIKSLEENENNNSPQTGKRSHRSETLLIDIIYVSNLHNFWEPYTID